MKKILFVLLVCLLLLTVAGCGDKSAVQSIVSHNEEVPSQSPTAVESRGQNNDTVSKTDSQKESESNSNVDETKTKDFGTGDPNQSCSMDDPVPIGMVYTMHRAGREGETHPVSADVSIQINEVKAGNDSLECAKKLGVSVDDMDFDEEIIFVNLSLKFSNVKTTDDRDNLVYTLQPKTNVISGNYTMVFAYNDNFDQGLGKIIGIDHISTGQEKQYTGWAVVIGVKGEQTKLGFDFNDKKEKVWFELN